MDSPNEPLLIFWRSFGNWGFLLVIAGVAGEVAAGMVEHWCEQYFDRYKSRWKLFEAIAGALVVVGLAMEYKGHQNETRILDADNAQSYLESKQAETNAAASYARAGEAIRQAGQANLNAAQFNERAADAEKEAGGANQMAALANERSAKLESSNLVLQIALEKLRHGRSINEKQKRDFIFLTERIAKVPIRIEIIAEGKDTEGFGVDLRDMFSRAGFKTNSEAGQFGITREPSLYVTPDSAITNEIPDLYILYHFANFTNGQTAVAEGFEITNGVTRFIVSETNQPGIASCLAIALKDIGIPTEMTFNPSIASSFYIYIPVK